MTLIVGLATPAFNILISDRRVVLRQDGEIKVVDDYANKLVLLGNDLAIGFAGLAYLEDIPTDQWIARTLSMVSGSIADRLNFLAERASTAIANSTLPTYMCKHCFLAVGWIRPENSPDLHSVIFKISNYHDKKLETTSDIDDRFMFHTMVLKKNQFYVESGGEEINAAERALVESKISTLSIPFLKEGDKFIDALRETILKVAKRSDFVGKSMLAVFLPIHSAESPDIRFQNKFGVVEIVQRGNDLDTRLDAVRHRKNPSFIDFPEFSKDFTAHGPILLTQHGLMLTDMKFLPLKT